MGGGATAAAGAIILKPAGDLTPPFRLDGQVSFGRSGNSARKRRASRGAQRGVAEAANIGRIAVNGAAMLTSFYHRSVLRCGCLAERKSGVPNILSAERRHEKIRIDLSRIGYPRQPGAHELQSIQFVEKLETLSFRVKRGISFSRDLNQREIPHFARNDRVRRFFPSCTAGGKCPDPIDRRRCGLNFYVDDFK